MERFWEWLLSLFGPQLTMGVPRDWRWSQVRDAYLKHSPRCRVCGGTKQVTAHHIWPVSWPGGKDVELIEANLITLCEHNGCHLQVGHLGDFRSRNPNVIEDARRWREKREKRPYPGEMSDDKAPGP